MHIHILGICGTFMGSLALLADAGHMLTDVLGLGMALAAIQLASRGARRYLTERSALARRSGALCGASDR